MRIISLSILFAAAFVYPVSKPSLRDGRTSYILYCKSCHLLFKETTGSPMYGMIERAPNREWIYKYIMNPAGMKAKDAYAACLNKAYPSRMPGLPLTRKEIDSIYTYVYAEAKKDKDIWKNKKFFARCK